MDWDKLRIFHAVAEAGSFTHAADSLKLSQSAISRQISSLEDSLNISLFHRHARGLILTEQGEVLYRTSHEIFTKLALTETQLKENKEKPKGSLRVTTTVALGSTWLTPKMKEFLDIYPDVRLELLLDDRELDLSMREADVAIRLSPPKQPGLIQRHLMTLQMAIYASHNYIEKYGIPKTLDDLEKHKLIGYGEGMKPPIPEVNWLLKENLNPRKFRKLFFTVNNIYAILRATENGIGIATLPDYLVMNNKNLIPILTELQGPKFHAYFVYPEELRNSKRIQVFRDFLLKEIDETIPNKKNFSL
ncbi:MAG: LysR family transcriptional regulator [Alphaproteobacteria bacterium]|nr:LysR family transcriptional regulator [Alphaproteobacteria bacterium]